jgi:4-amino-4-deoxy-L-arabinose transferase-like glycosyltransferase
MIAGSGGPTTLQNFLRLQASPVPGWLWIVLLWALAVFPAISLRSAHLEEGTVIALARGAAEDGWWLSPHNYGLRFVERPVLLSWIVAALGLLTGSITLWHLRIPHVLCLLAGALLVWRLVRSQASKAAALFAALCFFGCPMIAQKIVTAEPDVMVSVMLFAAFVLWWEGFASGGVSLSRCLSIGMVLGAAALTKGIQPMAYFSLGVGAYLLVRRRWRDAPAFFAANAFGAAICLAWYVAVREPGDLAAWISHSRIGIEPKRSFYDFGISVVCEWLPLSLVFPFAIRRLYREEFCASNELLLAVVLYASACTAVLLFWSDAATRYAMPATLALATMAGLMFDRWNQARPAVLSGMIAVVMTIASYPVVLGWIAMPLAPELFQASRNSARAITFAVQTMPGSLYTTTGANNNALALTPSPIRFLTLDDLSLIQPPFLALVTPGELEEFSARLPNAETSVWAPLPNSDQVFVQVRPKP